MARLKQSFSIFPLRKLLIWAVNSSIAQSHYCVSNDVKAKCRLLSRKFHEEQTLFVSTFAKPMKIRPRLLLFDKPIKCFAFLFTFCFYVYFSKSYKSHSTATEEANGESNKFIIKLRTVTQTDCAGSLCSYGICDSVHRTIK